MNFKEFRSKVLKLHSKHNFKVRNSHTSKDIYRWIIKNDKRMKVFTEKEFGEVIKALNNVYRNLLTNGKDVKLPFLGKLEVIKIPLQVKLVDGKLKIPKVIDWKKTLDLWYNDEESYNKSTLVYTERKELFTVKYNNKTAKFNNKSFYTFIPTRKLRGEISEKANKGLLDTINRYEFHNN